MSLARRFADLRLGVRLAVLFGLLAAAVLAIVVAGVMRLDALNAQFSQAVADRHAKTQLVHAFGERNLTRYLDRLAELVVTTPPSGWEELLDLAFDEYVAQRRSVPGFGVVDFALGGGEDPSQRLAEHLGDLIADLFQRSITVEIRRALRVAVLNDDLSHVPRECRGRDRGGES